jgi:hypothetical protein
LNRAEDVTELVMQKRLSAELQNRNKEMEFEISSKEEQRIEMKKELKIRDQQYYFLAEALPQFVWTADDKGFLDYINKRMSGSIQLRFEFTESRIFWCSIRSSQSKIS